jgi:hypothetical protein
MHAAGGPATNPLSYPHSEAQDAAAGLEPQADAALGMSGPR